MNEETYALLREWFEWHIGAPEYAMGVCDLLNDPERAHHDLVEERGY